MSAAAQTKLFGVRIPVDPKILFGGLAVLIAVLFWYNSRSDDEAGPPASTRTETARPAAAPLRTRTPVARRANATSDRGVLRLRPIDPTKGDIDPTLRLDLLARLQRLQPVTGGRSLFESGAQAAAAAIPVPLHPPIIRPGPRQKGPGMFGGPGGGPPGSAMAAIPLKYYGYVKPASTNAKLSNNISSNRGFFLDGDNVLIASEGELLKQRYLVVALTPTSARLEDTQIRQPQTLPVVVAAMP
jgi:hypothetical protein